MKPTGVIGKSVQSGEGRPTIPVGVPCRGIIHHGAEIREQAIGPYALFCRHQRAMKSLEDKEVPASTDQPYCWFGGRFGKFKRAYGLYNQARDIDAARNSVFLPLSVYNEEFRTFQQSIKGLSVYGTLPNGFDYQVQYGTVEIDSDRDTSSSGDSGSEVDDNVYVLHLEWDTPLEGLKLVGTYSELSFWSTLTQNDIETRIDMAIDQWLLGAEYSQGDITCAAEYTAYRFDFGSRDWVGQQYYGLINYRFTDWMALGARMLSRMAIKTTKMENGLRTWANSKPWHGLKILRCRFASISMNTGLSNLKDIG